MTLNDDKLTVEEVDVFDSKVNTYLPNIILFSFIYSLLLYEENLFTFPCYACAVRECAFGTIYGKI